MLEFDWDTASLEHIAEHGLSAEEVEYALAQPTLSLESQDWHESEVRFSEAGMTLRGRILQVVTTMRGTKIRVATAWGCD